MEGHSEELPPTDDVIADPAGDAPAESEDAEGNEGWEGPAEDLEEDPAYSPDDENLEGIKGG